MSACARRGEAGMAMLEAVIVLPVLMMLLFAIIELGIALGRELHRAIMDAAQNGIMADINKRLENMTVLTANITKRSPTIEKASAEAHLNIINAVLKQDQEKAEQMMREHMKETCQHIIEQFYPGMLGGFSNNKQRKQNRRKDEFHGS